MDTLFTEYRRRYEECLRPTAVKLETHLREILGGCERIDRIAARAKTPSSFVAKARRTDQAGGMRYPDPLHDIQDLIGARVIVFYLDDVEPVCATLLRYMREIENRFHAPEKANEFGYVGKHLILILPDEAFVGGENDRPTCFEIQIKTLFQHAWSEADHDLGYKTRCCLSDDQRRRLAYAAASSWGADRIFRELFVEIHAEPAESPTA